MRTSEHSLQPVFVAAAASALALAAAWLEPVAGLVIAGAVVLGGIVLFVTGRHAVGAIVCVVPFGVAILALQVAGLLVFKAYRVPSESMVPAVDIGDRLLVNRWDKTPSVGDIVIAHPPAGAVDDRCGTQKPAGAPCGQATPGLASVKFIKRVIAGPGDTVAFRHGLLIRNGRPVREPYAKACDERELCELPRAVKLPAETWFLAGDNRGQSDDSRIWGPVPTAAMVGTVGYRYWPPRRAGRL